MAIVFRLFLTGKKKTKEKDIFDVHQTCWCSMGVALCAVFLDFPLLPLPHHIEQAASSFVLRETPHMLEYRAKMTLNIPNMRLESS